MPDFGSTRSSGSARSSCCNNRRPKRPIEAASRGNPPGNSRCTEKSIASEYGVLKWLSIPQVMAKPQFVSVGGVYGYLTVPGKAQLPTEGRLCNPVKRGEVSGE